MRVLRLAVPVIALLIAGGGIGVATRAAGAPSSSATKPPGIVVADGHGWTAKGLKGPMPAPGTCHTRHTTTGEPLPDPKCTPGAIDAAVTNTNISKTVCRKGGYTPSVRPPVSLTEPVKKKLMAAYGIPVSQISKYELDHLIELNAGGASDIRNLWPEPNTLLTAHGSKFVHNDKDAVEEYTFQKICARKVTVSAVQKAVATNWTTAVAKLGLPPVPASLRVKDDD